jgi:hypothetical protein
MTLLAPALAQVYKWVDERGVTHYGERPPQGSKANEVPSRLGSPFPGSATGSQGSSQPNPGQGEPSPEPRPGTAQTEPAEDKQARRLEQCNQQRELLARLTQNPRPEIAGAIARQEKLVAEQCKDSERPAQATKANEAPSKPAPSATPTERADERQTRRQEQCNQQRDLLARLNQNPRPEIADAIARQEKLVAEQCKG